MGTSKNQRNEGFNHSMIKNLKIKEEEVEDVDKVQEEEAFVVLVTIAMKKVIDSLNALNDKEG